MPAVASPHYACRARHSRGPPSLLAVRLLRFAGTVVVDDRRHSRFCALLLAVRFLVFPRLEIYRGTSSDAVDASLGQPVRSTRSSTGWDGWNPRLAIGGLAHPRSRAARTAPVLAAAAGRRSSSRGRRCPLSSLRLKELIDRAARARDPARRGGHASTSPGFELDPEAQADDARATDWLLRQPRDPRARRAHHLERRAAQRAAARLDHVAVSARESFGRHRFGLTGIAARRRSPSPHRRARRRQRGSLARLARGAGARSTCASTTPTWRRGANGCRCRCRSRAARARCACGSIRGGKATDVVADLELAAFECASRRNAAAARSRRTSAGASTWKSDGSNDGLRRRATSRFARRTGSSSRRSALSRHDERGRGRDRRRASSTSTAWRSAPLSTLAEHLPLPERWRRDLARFALRGSVTRRQVRVDGAARRARPLFRQRRVRELRHCRAATRCRAPPAFRAISRSTRRAATLKLDSRDMRVDRLPRMFADTLQLRHRVGRVSAGRATTTNHGSRSTTALRRRRTPSGTATRKLAVDARKVPA